MNSSSPSPSHAYRQMKIVASVLLAILLGTFFYYSNLHDKLFQRKARQEVPEAGPFEARPMAMDFEFIDANSHKTLRLSNLRGQVVHINFWASWCLPCQAELPFLAKLQAEHPNQYAVILINLDDNSEARETALEMQNRLAPNLMSVYEKTAELRTLYNVEALPFHYILDKSGRAAAAFYSQLDKEEQKFKTLLLQLMAEGPATN